MSDAYDQWIRKVSLVVGKAGGDGLDFSKLRITFDVKMNANGSSPNLAQIRVYNLPLDILHKLRPEYTWVVLGAGYESNFGTIFQGELTQSRIVTAGTENYLELLASDSLKSYKYATVNTTLAAGSTAQTRMAACVSAHSKCGGTSVEPVLPASHPLKRGRVLYGSAHKHARKICRTNGSGYSVQNGVLQVLPLGSVLTGSVMTILNSHTGLIGSPEQTPEGIKGKCLLNPFLHIDSVVKINEADVQSAAIKSDHEKATTKPATILTGEDGEQIQQSNDAEKKPARIMADGQYKLLACDYKGDTHGDDWYCEFVALGRDETPPNSKQVTGSK